MPIIIICQLWLATANLGKSEKSLEGRYVHRFKNVIFLFQLVFTESMMIMMWKDFSFKPMDYSEYHWLTYTNNQYRYSLTENNNIEIYICNYHEMV